MRRGWLLRPGLAFAALTLLAAPRPVSADTIKTAVSIAPNWALGIPQFFAITGCSNAEPFLCPGGVSDSLSLTVPTRPTISGFLTECDELNRAFADTIAASNALGCGVAPVLWPGLHGGGAIDLIVPNTNWLFQAVYVWKDSPADPFISDGLVFFNFGTTAHLWLGSNWFDPPMFPSPSDLPDLFPGLTLPDPIDIGGSPFNADTGELRRDLIPQGQAPEPASLVLLGSGLIVLASRFRRRRR